MRDWTLDELTTIGNAIEVDVAPSRADDSSEEYTTIWVVRVGSELYVRSYRGRRGHWYRDAIDTGRGHLRAGSVERDVSFDSDRRDDQSDVDAAFRAKYGRSSYVDAMVSPDAAATTLRLVPRA
jgi:hypothetical protein